MKTPILLLSVLFLSTGAFAQAGLQILTVAPGATELSRAEASTAIPNGANAIYSNPGLLALDDHPSISLTYTNWISDSNNLFGGINLKKGNRAVAFSFYTSGVNGLEQRDSPGASNGDFSIQYLSISGAYSYNFNILSAGISAHYLNEEVFPYRATGYAISAGIATSLMEERFRLGASLLNIGDMDDLNEEPTDLPSSFNLGASFEVFQFAHKKNPQLPILITIMADYVVPFVNDEELTDINPAENYFNFGLSLLVADVIRVNTGYKTQENARPVSFGLDILFEKMAFNYALIPFNTGFGTVHSIGIQYQL
ncbi:MAG: PorV/PorQ family protein [Balneolales bacterium]|nr:PorV/PorQ family protein [Balneolales bacterium]